MSRRPWLQPGRRRKPLPVALRADDTEEPWSACSAAVGVVAQVQPLIQAAVSLPTRAFEHAWALAASGQLRYSHLSFTTPKRVAIEAPVSEVRRQR